MLPGLLHGAQGTAVSLLQTMFSPLMFPLHLCKHHIPTEMETWIFQSRRVSIWFNKTDDTLLKRMWQDMVHLMAWIMFFFILLPECLCFGNPKWQHFIQTARCGRFSVNQSSLSNVLFYMCTSRELCDKYNCISCGCFTIKAIQSFPSWTLTV